MQATNSTTHDILSSKLKTAMQDLYPIISSVKEHFIEQYPEYEATQFIDKLRDTDYGRLDLLGHTYLDYTGGGLYGESQIQTHTRVLLEDVYGNPHSLNPTSLAATEITEQARRYVLEYFNADPDEYLVIFTANASNALKLVGEAYPFKDNGQYLLTFDNHNSVNGIREYARCHDAKIVYTPLHNDSLRIDAEALHNNLDNAIPDGNNLFAFPAQSNFSGIQHDLDWIAVAQEKGWDVLLDAAAFVPTNRLDLSQHHPDFVTLSFYKMFGYPTGIGALIMKRSLVSKMQRPWFGGGTIKVASVRADGHYLHTNEAGYEDGTINYLGIPAVEIGLRHMQSIGIDLIHERVMILTDYLLKELTALQHDNGQALIYLYGANDIDNRGGTVALNFYDSEGTVFDYRVVEALANYINLSVRTGCFCNPGAGETALQISETRLQECFRRESLTFEELMYGVVQHGDADIVGAIRVSLGIVSNFEDVYRFINFAKFFLNTTSSGIQMPV